MSEAQAADEPLPEGQGIVTKCLSCSSRIQNDVLPHGDYDPRFCKACRRLLHNWEAYVDGKPIGTVKANNEMNARVVARSKYAVPFGTHSFSVKQLDGFAEPHKGKYLWLFRKPHGKGYNFAIGGTPRPVYVRGDSFNIQNFRFAKSVPIPDSLTGSNLDYLSDWYVNTFGV